MTKTIEFYHVKQKRTWRRRRLPMLVLLGVLVLWLVFQSGCRPALEAPKPSAITAMTPVEAPALPQPWPPNDVSMPIAHEDGSVTLPADLAAAVDHRLALGEELVLEAARKLQQQRERDAVSAQADLDYQASLYETFIVVQEESGEGWRWWEVLGLSVGGVVVGAVTGLVVGLIAAD